ncbi:MAG: sarcosine oxidase subunit delta [Candidatus Promineifilaceae bacterium]|nr:sarcosine oxidase subunit delta [Candidatus Promineifilaceae bacterium]
MILIDCPNCGPRNAQEFRYGGEYNPRPKQAMAIEEDAWTDYVYMRDNRLGVQQEWWYHRAGCQLWFLAERHTKSNEVHKTYRWSATSD